MSLTQDKLSHLNSPLIAKFMLPGMHAIKSDMTKIFRTKG